MIYENMMYKNRVYNGLSEYSIVCKGICKNMVCKGLQEYNIVCNGIYENMVYKNMTYNRLSYSIGIWSIRI